MKTTTKTNRKASTKTDKKTGKITPNGVILKPHELETVVFLTEQGYDISLVPKSNKYGERSPDLEMIGLLWEMKAPKGEGTSLMKNTLQKAAKQSENVIVDLRRTKRHQTKCLKELEREFYISKRIKRLKVITKTQKLLDFMK